MIAQGTNGPRGRPRSERADAAILGAAVSMFAELGLDRFSVEGVARRAAVAKTTVYRRYPSKSALVAAIDGWLTQRIPSAPDTGALRGDLEAVLTDLTRMFADETIGRVVLHMGVATVCGRRVADTPSSLLERFQAPVAHAVRQGVERGEIAEPLDVDFVTDLAVGPVFVKALLSDPLRDPLLDPSDDRFLAMHVDALMRSLDIGLAVQPPPGTPLP